MPDGPNNIGNDDTSIHSSPSELQDLATLYTINILEELSSPPAVNTDYDDTALYYMSVKYNLTVMEVNLIHPMTGLVDYDQSAEDRKDTLGVTFVYDFTDGAQCDLFLIHDIQDENTQEPHFEYDNYLVEVREDLSLELPLTFYPQAVDFDKSLPNNEFNVNLDSSCPLEVVGDGTFSTSEGTWTAVQFQLSKDSHLDFDTMEEPYIYCDVSLTDNGDIPLESFANFTIEVMPYPDEDPVFTRQLYLGYISSVTEGTIVYIEPPIEAEDKDKPPSPVTYSMVDSNSEVQGSTYFSINATTGEVSVTQDISDNDFLSNGNVYFTLTATDGDDGVDFSLLNIDLDVVTTIATSTPTTAQTSTAQTTAETSTAAQTTTETSITQTAILSTSMPTDPTWSSTISSTTTCAPCMCNCSADALNFERSSYIFEAVTSSSYIGTITASSGSEEAIMYSWDESYEPENIDLFSLDPTSGDVSAAQLSTPRGDYWLKAVATTNTESATAMVNIIVEELSPGNLPFVSQPLLQETVPENGEAGPLELSVTAEGATFYCIEAVEPVDYTDSVSISSENGSIILNGPLDAESALGNQIKIKVGTFNDVQEECPQKNIDEDLISNEAMVVLTVTDENDNSPVFVDIEGKNLSATTVVAYPLDRSLQRAMGQIWTLMATDADLSGDSISFGISDGDNADIFAIDQTTGTLYLRDQSKNPCDDQCTVTVTAFDGVHSQSTNIKVLTMDIEMVYTLQLEDVSPDQVESELFQVSKQTGGTVAQVYMTIVSAPDPTRAADSWLIDVHLYATENDAFLSMDDFNDALDASPGDWGKAKTFSEQNLFDDNENTSDTGYKVAVGILGTVVCLTFIVGIIWMVKQRRDRGRVVKVQYEKTTAKANHGFSADEEDEDRKKETFATIFVDEYSTPGSTTRSKISMTESTKFPPLTHRTRTITTSTSGSEEETRDRVQNTFVKSSVGKETVDEIVKVDVDVNDVDEKGEKRNSLETSELVAEVHNSDTDIDMIMETTSPKVGVETSSTALNDSPPPYSQRNRSGSIDNLSAPVDNGVGDYKPSSSFSTYFKPKEEESKSVAFKVLVDTAEFQTPEHEQDDEVKL